jgi:hypothetical protein
MACVCISVKYFRIKLFIQTARSVPYVRTVRCVRIKNLILLNVQSIRNNFSIYHPISLKIQPVLLQLRSTGRIQRLSHKIFQIILRMFFYENMEKNNLIRSLFILIGHQKIIFITI